MRKTSSLCRIFIRIILLFFLLIVLLLCNSAAWLLEVFGPISFSTVLYQLNSPLRGTGHEIVWNYLINCLAKSVLEIVCFGIIWRMIANVRKKLKFRLKGRIFDKKIDCTLGRKEWRCIRLFTWATIMILCVVSVYRYACLVGIPSYIKQINAASTLYEDEYVDPDTVQIIFPENKKNLIYIYMESMESTYASKEVGGGKDINYIPNLTEMADQYISFSDTDKLGGLVSYAGSGWTMASLMASTAGVHYGLPIEGNSAGDYETILPGVVSLGEILQGEGYHNYFMCGSDAEFGGRELYFEQHGDYTIFDYYDAIEDGLIPDDYYEFWGFEDEKLYQYAREKLEGIGNRNEPFNFTMLTVDTHHMDGYICELCGNEYPQDYANAIACADRQIAEFIEWIQEQGWYDDTVVVIVGDHISMNNNFWEDVPKDYNRRTYNCFINVDKEKDAIRTKNRNAYAMDLLPTTLSALSVQIEGDRLGLGTDLFSGRQTLAEQIENFEEETLKYSEYYFNHLIMR